MASNKAAMIKKYGSEAAYREHMRGIGKDTQVTVSPFALDPSKASQAGAKSKRGKSKKAA